MLTRLIVLLVIHLLRSHENEAHESIDDHSSHLKNSENNRVLLPFMFAKCYDTLG